MIWVRKNIPIHYTNIDLYGIRTSELWHSRQVLSKLPSPFYQLIWPHFMFLELAMRFLLLPHVFNGGKSDINSFNNYIDRSDVN